MIFFILFCIVLIYTIISIIRSGKPAKQILTEIKLEFIYHGIGMRATIEDILMKSKNKTELPLKNGKIAVVTGGSRGIGVEIVKMLMQCDMHVIVGCRNVSAGETLEATFRKEGITTGELKCFPLDLNSMKSVREFGETILEKYQKIHVLVNNAGIMFAPFKLTEDGFESHFAVNYLGHFLLTHLLMPRIIAARLDSNSDTDTFAPRIVNVSSAAHLAGEINFEDINLKKQYIAPAAYAQSKLAQVLFTNYLQSLFRAAGNSVQVYSVHPGIVNTDLLNNTAEKKLLPWLPGLIFKDPVAGAIPVVYCCVSPQLEGKGGVYVSNCQIITNTNPIAKSVEVQEKLFIYTKELLNIDSFGIVV